MPMTTIDSMLELHRPLILDGGLGSELEARGHDLSSPLWSAGLVLDNPQAIVDVHRAYLDAGAHCLISASYQASLPGLEAAGQHGRAIEAVFTGAVDLACRARDEFLQDRPDCAYRPLVAASVGPYGAYLADGSEYRGHYAVSDRVLHDFHHQRLAWLDRAGADLLACETLPDLQEAKVLARLLETCSTPAWVSFCCRDSEHLHDGSRLRDAVALFTGLPGLAAVGVNCCDPALVTGLIATLREAAEAYPIVVYPNSGSQYDAGRNCWRGTRSAAEWARLASGWYRAGAAIIGGCCRTGPAHIQQMAKTDTWHF